MQTFLVKMSFVCMKIKNNLHKKGFALALVLKQRLPASRKRPIVLYLQIYVLRRRPLREINFEKRKSLIRYFFFDILGIFGPNFKTIRPIPIPYKFIQIWNTRVKPKSDFFASKGLETFHAFAAPYVNTVATVDGQ